MKHRNSSKAVPGGRRTMSSMAKREAKWFYLFVLPWILGFLIFTLIPMGTSAVLSFMDWDYIRTPEFVGWDNFVNLFHDDLFYKSLLVTTVYSVCSVPLSLLVSFIFALLLNSGVKGLSIFRTVVLSALSGIGSGGVHSLALDVQSGIRCNQYDSGIFRHQRAGLGI